jgi:hypothetical protein
LVWGSKFDAQATGLQHSGRECISGPEVGPHTGQEFLEGERLAEVVVRAEIEPFDPVAHAPPGTEHQDRNRGSPLPQACKHLKAVQVGQAEIQYHQVIAHAGDLAPRDGRLGVEQPGGQGLHGLADLQQADPDRVEDQAVGQVTALQVGAYRVDRGLAARELIGFTVRARLQILRRADPDPPYVTGGSTKDPLRWAP